MSGQELLDDLAQLADDFMTLAVDRDGAVSGIAAECSQKLKDIHFSFTDRFRTAGEPVDG